MPPPPSSCHAQACPYFNASCQSLCIRLCLFGCVFISFPFDFVACFDRFFLMWVIMCIYLLPDAFEWFVHMWVWAPVNDGLFELCAPVCLLYQFWHMFTKITLSVIPLLSIPSTFLIAAVENRLRRINLLFFVPVIMNSCRTGSDIAICCKQVGFF